MKKEEVKIVSEDGHIVHGTYSAPERTRACALLVHGITADRHEWGFFDSLVREFADRGVSTLAIDYRGHGMSKFPIERLSLSGVMADVMAAWSFLQKATPSVHSFIVGNSFGGGIAYLFGQNEKDCAHIYMTCPVTSYVADVSRVNSAWKDQAGTGLIQYASKKLSTIVVPEFYAYDFLIQNQHVSKPFSVVHGAE
ncbi:MAG: alpha/beta fold hydrolase, partial [Bdellovibrionales bacterium]|nr:alpha/beta fold hydrolase [Bdellovibrionales bacterium]